MQAEDDVLHDLDVDAAETESDHAAEERVAGDAQEVELGDLGDQLRADPHAQDAEHRPGDDDREAGCTDAPDLSGHEFAR